MRHLRQQAGAAVIYLALALSVLAGIAILVASQYFNNLTKAHRSAQAKWYGNQMANDLAQKLRWAYDIGLAVVEDPANGALLCPNSKNSLITVGSPGFQMCIPNGGVCTTHPLSQRPVCVTPADGSVTASFFWGSRKFRVFAFLSQQEGRADIYTPPPPPIGETTNDLTVSPNCVAGNCYVHCGVNADCVTFKFCPLVGNCGPTDFISQTVGFVK